MTRLGEAEQLIREALHDVPMGNDWTQRCRSFLEIEVPMFQCRPDPVTQEPLYYRSQKRVSGGSLCGSKPAGPGVSCPDGGKCHHGCDTPCWRRDEGGCVPLTISGLDDNWEIPK